MNTYRSQKSIQRRFYIRCGLKVGDRVSITGQDAVHIQRVLRLRPGNAVEGFDGEGGTYRCEISQMVSSSIDLIVTGTEKSQSDSMLFLSVAVGFLKEKKMDRLVHQLTELGVANFVPFFADRSIAHIHNKRFESRIQRWEKIGIEALKQCRRNRKIKITPALSFDEMIRMHDDHDVKILFWENATQPLSSVLHGKEMNTSRKILIIIGPEGGFDEKEVSFACDFNCHVLSMGKRILKAETAAVFTSGLVQYLWGDIDG